MSRLLARWVLLTALLFGAGYEAGAATADEWRRDLAEIERAVVAYHPSPFLITGRLAFSRRLEDLMGRLPELTDEQRLVEAMRLVASLRDSRTRLEPYAQQYASWYPVRFYDFDDGYFITAAHRSVGELAGAEVLEIGDRPVQVVANEARALFPAANASAAREWLHALSHASLMRGLGLAAPDGRLLLKVRLPGGRVVRRTLSPRVTDDASFEWHIRTEMFGIPLFEPPEDWISAVAGLPASAFFTPDRRRAPHLMYRGSFHAVPLDAETFYIQVNRIGDTSRESFRDFVRRAFAMVDAASPSRLILDFRYCPGGDGSKIRHLLRAISERAERPPWRRLYIVTGRRTAGAALSAVDGIADTFPSSVVGEPSGAPINSFGDSQAISLGGSGTLLFVSTRYHQHGLSDDIRDAFPVDHPAQMTFADYIGGADPAVDPILRGEEMGGLLVVAGEKGGAAARRLFRQRERRFRDIEGWRPPGFEEIKRAGYALLSDDRPLDAIELFELMAEQFPDHWNSWESLGRAQVAAGLLAESRRSYRCALALDPENFDSGDLRRALAEAPGEPQMLPAGCPGAG